jgi:hypothetical protein
LTLPGAKQPQIRDAFYYKDGVQAMHKDGLAKRLLAAMERGISEAYGASMNRAKRPRLHLLAKVSSATQYDRNVLVALEVHIALPL